MRKDLPQTAVRFDCDDPLLMRLFEQAERKLAENLQDFDGRQVLIEGAGYHKIWLETQPMGGEMYAKRNLEAALNNTLMFLDHQREDGRLPGSIKWEDGKLTPEFNKFQGFCFPRPALNLYYWLDRDEAYLERLRGALEAFDAYLWRVRDSDGDGLLESWCVTDTGEDGALRYGDAPFWWDREEPPRGYRVVPMASMDFMSYSYSAREVLAHIARLRGDGQRAALWGEKALSLRRTIREKLWDEARGACFDRDHRGRVLPTLIHNNLRCMYWGSFDRQMARRFVREHLLDERGFWTPMPLCSVAVSDPLFRNLSENNWSGQPEGLTYQRCIRALSNYGFHDILPRLADKLFSAIGMDAIFCQQFDPFTGARSSKKDGYGPTMLAVLEFIARLHGIHMETGEIHWAVLGGVKGSYAQQWGERRYELVSDGGEAKAFLNGRELFRQKAGDVVVTDAAGGYLRRLPLRER